MILLLHISPVRRDFFYCHCIQGCMIFKPKWMEVSAPTMVPICGKSTNVDFLGQTGPKKVRSYTEKSEFYHFPFVQCIFYIDELSQQL